MRGVAKRDLPVKNCAHCGRPFSWRRKWARDWEDVRYCSDGCRRGRPVALDFGAGSGDDERTARPPGTDR
jgi:hypothetical protein